MRKRGKKNTRRLLSLLLSAAMVFSAMPSGALTVSAADENGLCEHHTAHTADCGYIAAQGEIPCNMGCTDTDSDGVIDHAEGCAYTPAVAGSPCAYVCAECAAAQSVQETGEVETTPEPEGTSEPTSAIEPMPTAEPTPTEEPSQISEPTPTADPAAIEEEIPEEAASTAVERVQALIDALPSAEEITADNAEDVAAQLTAIDTAKADLTDEELDRLDVSRYAEAAAALEVLSGMSGSGEPMLLEDAVASVTINGVITPYAVFTEAWAAAQTADSATVTLLADVDLGSNTLSVNAGKDITLTSAKKADGGEYSLTTKCSSNFIKVNGTFTLAAGNISNSYSLLACNGIGVFNGIFRMTGGSVRVNDSKAAAVHLNGGSAEISGGTLDGGTGTGMNVFRASSVSITGGIFSGTSGLTVSSNISSNNVVAISAGTFSSVNYDGGAVKDLLVSGCAYYKDNILVTSGLDSSSLSGDVTVKGCTHSYEDGVCVACGATCTHTWKDGVCTICSVECAHSYANGICTVCHMCQEHSFDYTVNEDGTHSGTCSGCGATVTEAHTFDENGSCTLCGVAEAVAVATVTIGNETKEYTDLTEAWAAANGSTATITLLANVDLEGASLTMTGGSITWNGGEYTVTSDVAGDGTVHITHGTFTLNSGTIENTNSTGYGLYAESDTWFDNGGSASTGSGVYVNVCGGTVTGGSVGLNWATYGFGIYLSITAGTFVGTGEGSYGLWLGSYPDYAQIRGGTFSGTAGAIICENNHTISNYILARYACYRDESLLLRTELAGTTVTGSITVAECPGHSFSTYTQYQYKNGTHYYSVHYSNCIYCGETKYGDHTVVDGECTLCGAEYVATVTTSDGATTYYAQFSDAWSAAQTAGTATVTLLADVDLGESGLTVASGQDITLTSGTDADGNEYSLTMTSTGYDAVAITVVGTFTLEGGNVSGGNSGLGINVYGGSFTMTGGSVSVNGGGYYAVCVWNSGSADIRDGVLIGMYVRSGASAVSISGGTFSGTYGLIVNTGVSNGTVTITGGTFSTVEFDYQSNNKAVRALLGSDCAYYDSDGTLITEGLDEYKLSSVKVKECEHSYEDGQCVVCGAVCTHDFGENGTCTLCQTHAVASVTVGEEVTYYADFAEAWSDAQEAESATLTLHQSVDVKGLDVDGFAAMSSGNVTLEMDEDVVLSSSGRYTVILLRGGTLTLKSGTIQGNSASEGVWVIGGELIVSGGTVSGLSYGVWVERGTVRISDGQISGGKYGLLDSSNSSTSATISLTGGTFTGTEYGAIYSTRGRAIKDYLATGYVYKQGDNVVTDSATLSGSTLTGTVTVVPCTHESTTTYAPNADGLTHSAFCDLCGAATGDPEAHTFNDNGTCTVCGVEAVATVVVDGGEAEYYADFTEAWSAAVEADSAILTLLKSVRRSDGITMTTGNVTLNMAEGVTLTYTGTSQAIYLSGGTLTLASGTIQAPFLQMGISVAGGTLIVKDGTVDGGISGIYVSSGSVQISGGTIKGTNRYGKGYGLLVDGGSVQLGGGTFKGDTIGINVASDAAVMDFLAEGYAYKQNDAWVTGDALNGTSLTGTVTVEQAPIQILELTASPESPTYNEEFTLTAEVKLADGESKSVDYKWYVDGNTSVYYYTNPVQYSFKLDAGDHTFTCVATCDGYDLTKEITVTIGKATPVVGEVSLKDETQVIYSTTAAGDVTLTRTDETVPGTLALAADATFTEGEGTYSWVFTPDDTENYEIVTGEITITVTRDTLERITASGNLNKTDYVYGDTFDPSGLTVTATYASGQTVDVTEDVTFGDLSAGQNSIELSYTDGEITAACTVDGLTITQLVAELEWSNIGLTYNGAAQKPTAVVTNLVSGDTCTVTVTGEQINVGNYTAAAEALSNGNYVLPDEVTQAFAIQPKEITVTIIAGGGVYGGTITPATAEPNGVVEGDTVNVVLTYTGTANDGTEVNSTETPTRAGIYTVTAAITDTNYTLPETTAAFAVEKADAGLSISPVENKTYGSGTFALDAAAVSGGKLHFESSDESVLAVDESGTVTIAAAGTATITVSVDETENYRGDSKKVTITVEKKGSTLVVTDFAYETVTYGDADFSISRITSEGGSEITYTSSNTDVVTVDNDGTVHIVGVGTATITLSMAESGNYGEAETTVTVTVDPKPITITADDRSKVYGGEIPELTWSITGGALVEGDELYGITARCETDGNAGVYDITVSQTDGANPNYEITFVNGTLTISPLAAKLAWSNTSLTYNGTAQKPTAAVTNLLSGDICTVTVTGEQTDVGSYTAIATALSNKNYTLPEGVTQAFVILEKEITVTITPGGGVYGGEIIPAAAQLNGVAEGERVDVTLTYTGKANDGTEVDGTAVPTLAGTYTVTATITGGNYSLSGTTTAAFVVDKANAGLSISPVEDQTYGGNAFALTVTSASNGTLHFASSNEDVVTVDADGTVHIVGVGTATITLTMAESSNYGKAETAVTVTVNPKPIMITADDQSMVYGEDTPELTWNITKGALVNGDTLTGIQIQCENSGDAGEYAIAVSQTKGVNPNYAITFVNGTLTIGKKDISGGTVELGAALTANGESQTQEVAGVTVQNSRGEDMEVTYTVTGNQATEPGAYTMTITGTGNFTGSITRTFVIAPGPDNLADTDENGDEVIGEGTIGVAVHHEDGAPQTELHTSETAIIAMLVANGGLNSEELALVAKGADIHIILKITNADDIITAESRTQIEKAAKGYTIGQYIDISLFKRLTVDGEAGELVQITGTHDNITVSIQVPENLLNKDSSVTRTFRIVRNHDGEVEFLPTAYDAGTNTLTFETDRFSDYAIVYQDEEKTTQDNGNSSGDSTGDSTGDSSGDTEKSTDSSSQPSNTDSGTVPQTGDDSQPWLWLLLMILSCSMTGTMIYSRRRKRRA